MSLVTRTILLITLLVLTALLGLGLERAMSTEPTDQDNLVADRNFRRAISYRIVDFQGGLVGRSRAGAQFPVDTPLPHEEHPGAKLDPMYSLIAIEGHEANLVEAEYVREIQRLQTDGWDENGKHELSVRELNNLIVKFNRDRTLKVSELNAVEESFLLFAKQIDAYSYMIQSFQQRIFNLDYEVHLAIIEQNALMSERDQVMSDAGRLVASKASLEDQNYDTNKKYDKTSKVIRDYEIRDPTLRGKANRVGNPWLRGVVTRAHSDSRVGQVWISLGKQDGVKLGQQFSIHRMGEFVGRIRVEAVDRNGSAGRLLEQFRGRVDVRTFDRVRASPDFAYGSSTGRE